MSETVSFRVEKETKIKMKKFKDRINWNEALKEFLNQKIFEIEKVKKLEKIDKVLSSVKPTQKGTAAGLVREDRDSH